MRYVDDHLPGFVECAFVDADGAEHRFVEKVTVVSREHLSRDSQYPKEGVVTCEVLKEWVENGRALTRVSTERPWGIESIEGVSEFVLPTLKVRS